jgi:hypothetical protein
MPLDAHRAMTKTEALTDAFANIGHAAGTLMPRSVNKASEPLAWEYYLAKLLEKTAAARTKKAIKAAVTGGVLFDHSENPEPIGTNRVVYDGDVIRIDLEVGTPGTKLDVDALIPALVKAGLRLDKVNELINKHTVENAAPHKFTSSLVTAR